MRGIVLQWVGFEKLKECVQDYRKGTIRDDNIKKSLSLDNSKENISALLWKSYCQKNPYPPNPWRKKGKFFAWGLNPQMWKCHFLFTCFGKRSTLAKNIYKPLLSLPKGSGKPLPWIQRLGFFQLWTEYKLERDLVSADKCIEVLWGKSWVVFWPCQVYKFPFKSQTNDYVRCHWDKVLLEKNPLRSVYSQIFWSLAC